MSDISDLFHNKLKTGFSAAKSGLLCIKDYVIEHPIKSFSILGAAATSLGLVAIRMYAPQLLIIPDYLSHYLAAGGTAYVLQFFSNEVLRHRFDRRNPENVEGNRRNALLISLSMASVATVFLGGGFEVMQDYDMMPTVGNHITDLPDNFWGTTKGIKHVTRFFISLGSDDRQDAIANLFGTGGSDGLVLSEAYLFPNIRKYVSRMKTDYFS